MDNTRKKLLLIKVTLWLGIAADTLWAVALFVPSVFGMLTGKLHYNPDTEVRLIMGIGGTLMTGWTLLLLWAVRKPVERRMVILLTAFPVVFGMFTVALIAFIGGNRGNIWILLKTTILMITMLTSYIIAAKMDRESSKKSI